MMNDWLKVSLGEVVTLQRGFDLPSQNRKTGKVPIVSSSGISDYHSEVGVKGPGVVTGRYGTIGKVFFVQEDYWPLNTTLWVKDFHGNDPKFSSYLLRTVDFNSCSDKSSVPGVNRNDLHRIPVLLPPLSTQRAIASVLGTLDDLIELNRETNELLEEMARALFKSWFVDFDPVRAKLEGRPPAGMDTATAALFPDHFQDSELGQIPRGWEVVTLGSILDVLETGRRPKGGVSGYSSGVPSVGAESINGIGVFDFSKTKFIPHEFYEKTTSGRIQNLDVLLYKDGGKPGEFRPRVGLYGYEFPFKEFCINEHVFRMRADSVGQHYLYFTISDERVLLDFANKGGKAAIPGINQTDVRSTQILLPPKDILAEFDKQAQPICQSIIENFAESRDLATLRDTLLPKLLSGEISLASTGKMSNFSEK
jgi:type I restriction enzyme S subunit